MLCVSEEIVAWFNILVNHVVLVTISQGCGSLQSDTSELVEVPIQVIIAQRTTTQILHQFVVAILAVNIGLTIVYNLDNHLQIKILDDAHQRFIDSEVRVVYLQHLLAFIIRYQEHLCLTRIITNAPDTTINNSLKNEISTAIILHEG